MIEIIQEENWDDAQEKKGLPKNIKQIGTPDIGDRIYIENAAYQNMHPHGQYPEKMVYIMLGRFDDFAGHACIFVEDAIEMSEVEFVGNIPNWNDDSWGHLYRKLKQKHEDMIIVGWAVDVCGQLPNMTAQLERVHQNYFGGVHQVLFLLDTLEREELFYSQKNGYLKRREGFYIYYDKNIPSRMEAEAESAKKERQDTAEPLLQTKEKQSSDRQQNYRKYLNARRVKKRKMRQPVYKSSYTPTVLLLLIIAALGYSAFQNQQKMSEMEQALTQMNELQAVMQTEGSNETVIRVEDIAGNVSPSSTQTADTQTSANDSQSVQASAATQTQETTQPPATMQTQETTPSPTETQLSQTTQTSAAEATENQDSKQEQAEPTLSEAETYLAQGYYIVQKGDSMVSICKKIYHTTAMLDKLCEINNIENPDAIYAGQYLDLPK